MGLFGTKMHYMMFETTAGDEMQMSDLIVHIVQAIIHGKMIMFLMNSDLF